MRLAAAGLLASGAVIGLAAPASAGTYTVHGGCSLFYEPDPSSGNYQGMMGESSTTTDSSGAPVTATVNCWMLFDGYQSPNTYLTASGNGSQSDQLLVEFSAPPPTVVQLCQRVDFADGTSTPTSCRTVSPGFTPPPA